MQQTAARPSILNNQKGFTLIELIVVIVILGIMAAVAIPKFADIQTEARIAKMQGALGAMKGAAGIGHGSWLVKGGTSSITTVSMEGTTVPINFGYPDVGGDNYTNTATSAANSGIVLASGGLTDYVITTPAATATTIVITPDTGHSTCTITYTEPTGANLSPTFTTALTSADCD
jgi:MSHA pilin protein MshA